MKLQSAQSHTDKQLHTNKEKMLKDLIYEVVLWSYKEGSRSPKRTDHLHKGFMEILRLSDQSLLLPFNVVHEAKTKDPADSSDTFKIDVLLENPQYNIALLFKLIASSYNKNRNNYRDTTSGERDRYLANREGKNRKLAHINILPKFCPVFRQNGKIKSIEKVNPKNVDKYNDYHCFVNDPIEAKLIFEIDQELLKSATSRNDLYNLMKEAGSPCVTVADEEQFISRLSQFIRI